MDGDKDGIVSFDDFKRFILHLIEEKHYCPKTIESMYSHCQKAAVELFNMDLNATKSIYDAIKWYGKGTKVKKAKAFESGELDRFYALVDLRDTWMLVRVAVAIIAYFGGLRIAEVKPITYGGKNPFIFAI